MNTYNTYRDVAINKFSSTLLQIFRDQKLTIDITKIIGNSLKI